MPFPPPFAKQSLSERWGGSQNALLPPLSHCSFHLGLIWRFVFKHENGYHQTELLGHPFIYRSQEWGYAGAPPFRLFPLRPFQLYRKGELGKGEKGRKSRICLLCFLHSFTILLVKRRFWSCEEGVAQSEEGKEPTDARTPLAIIKIHSSGLCLHLPCTD